MRPNTHAVFVGLLVIGFAGAILANVAPSEAPPSSNRTSGSAIKDAVEDVDYGFCSGPQNARSYASAPVKIAKLDCNDMSQTFSATSDGPSAGHDCGGYAIALGPSGKLNPSLTEIKMIAEWADAPLQNSQECNSAKLAAQAWGERCLNQACDKTTWDLIEGGPKQREGKWENQACVLQVRFTSQNVRYKTLNLDIIASKPEGNEVVRKRAKGTIVAEKTSGKPCLMTQARIAKK